MKLFLPHENRRIELNSGCCLLIGRQEGVDLRLSDKRVSRRHAEIREEDGRVYVQDLGSHAGCWKNDVRITEKTEFHSGDRLRIGDYEFLFEASKTEPPEKKTKIMPSPDLAGSHVLPLYQAQTDQQNLFTEAMMELSKKVQSHVLEQLNVQKDAQNHLTNT